MANRRTSFDDSYVVRIFRREARVDPARRAHDRVALTGIVEDPGSGAQRAFRDIEELWALLSEESSCPHAGGREDAPPRRFLVGNGTDRDVPGSLKRRRKP
jgi:hypothetical protein